MTIVCYRTDWKDSRCQISTVVGASAHHGVVGGDGVAHYRVYRLTNKRIAGPPDVVTCDSDEEAIRQAEQLVDGHDIELWEGRRFVTIIECKGAK